MQSRMTPGAIIVIVTCITLFASIPLVLGGDRGERVRQFGESILGVEEVESSKPEATEGDLLIEPGPAGPEPGPEAIEPATPVLFPGQPDTEEPVVPEAVDEPATPGFESAELTPEEREHLVEPDVGAEPFQVDRTDLSDDYGSKREGEIDQRSTWLPSSEDEFGAPNIAPDPVEIFAPVPYELQFVGGVKSPSAGLDPLVRQRIDALLDAGELDENATTYGFLMLQGRLRPDRLEELQGLDVKLIQRHPERSWKVRVPLLNIDAILALPYVYWFGYADRQQKLDLPVQQGMAMAPYSEERRYIYLNVMDDDTSDEAYDVPHMFGDQTRYFLHSNGPVERALVEAGFEVERFDPGLNLFVTRGTNAAIGRIIDQDWLLFVEYEPSPTLHLDQSSPLGQIDELWNGSYTGGGTSVGIIDTGAETGGGGHSDLNHISSCGINYSGTSNPWTDENGHGTHVTGIIASNSDCDSGKYHGQAAGVGTDGVRYRIAKMTLNSSDRDDLLDALDWMESVDPGSCTNTPKAQVVNNSWGWTCASGSTVSRAGTDTWSRKADEQVYSENIALIFSAGNGQDTDCDGFPDYFGSGSLGVPGVAKNVLTVGSCNDDLQNIVGDRSDFSSQGPTDDGRLKPDVNAPGCSDDNSSQNRIWSTGNASSCDMDDKCGTSMAAPHVTGISASVMDHYTWLRDDPSRLKSWLMARSIPHNNSMSSHNAYGAGRVDAYVAHWGYTGANGWSGGSFHGAVDYNTWIYFDIEVPSDADRLVIVLAWDEPPASAGGSSAVDWDLDLYADLEPFSSSGNVGTYSSISSINNVELIRVNNPQTGNYRLKVYNYDAPVLFDLHADVSYFIVRGDTSPTHNLTLSSTDQCIQPNTTFDVTVTASFSAWIGSCLQAQVNSLPSGVSITDLDAVRENGVNFDYDAGDDELTLGSIHTGDSRSATWRFQSTVEGNKTISISTDTDNSGTQTSSLVFGVDGTPPGLVTFTGSNPATSTWTNDNTVFITWDPASDDRCGVDGYGEFWSNSAGGAPSNVKDLEETVTSTTSSALSDADWYYKLNTVDNAGNWSTSFEVIGPFKIDTTDPEAVTNLTSTSHTAGVWSADNTIDFGWTAATDARSGIDGYGLFLSNGGPGLPSPVKDIEEVTTYTTGALASNGAVWFNIRSVDNAGNWDGDFVSVGPYQIDTTDPTPVTSLTSTSHTVGTWSNNTTINMDWSAAIDAHSGIAGYSIVWSESPSTIPDLTPDVATTSTSSPALADGDWWFHIRSIDNVGNASSTVHQGPFRIDATVPTDPTLSSTSHTEGECSSDCTIDMEWTGATASPFTMAGIRAGTIDAILPEIPVSSGGVMLLGSDIAGYSILWTQAPASVPDETIDTVAESHTSPCHPTGDWWFHLRTADVAGNWSGPVHMGPFSIDQVPPSNPTAASSASHTPSSWSNDRSVEAEWSGATDIGCGIAGYSIAWTTAPGTIPDATIETVAASTVSPDLTDGTSWYLHIRTVDEVGQPATGARHFGPFWIDGTAPLAHVTYPNGTESLEGGTAVNITFDASDGQSGIGNVKVELSTDSGSSWPEEIYNGPDPAGSVPWNVPSINTITARIRVTVTDLATNSTSDMSDGDFEIFTTTGVEPQAMMPVAFALSPSSPNPLRTSSMIRFDLPHERPVELDVFSVAGRHVVSLVDRTLPAGTHTVRWDGRDQAGVKVAPGVYLSRLKAGDFMATRKITVAR